MTEHLYTDYLLYPFFILFEFCLIVARKEHISWMIKKICKPKKKKFWFIYYFLVWIWFTLSTLCTQLVSPSLPPQSMVSSFIPVFFYWCCSQYFDQKEKRLLLRMLNNSQLDLDIPVLQVWVHPSYLHLATSS